MAGNQLRATIVVRTLMEMSSYDEHGVNQGHSETIGLPWVIPAMMGPMIPLWLMQFQQAPRAL